MTFHIYFPPRIVAADETTGDPTSVLDRARDEYLEGGIAILSAEEHFNNALKVCEFSKSFPDLQPPK